MAGDVLYNTNAIIEHPGVAQLVARVVWDHEAAGSNPVTRTKNPLISCEIRGFFNFLDIIRNYAFL